MNTQSNIIILVLAAGASSRMGQSKQLLEIHGQTLLQRTLQTAKASGADKVVVVLGSNEKIHRRALENEQVDVVHHADWQKGMGSSIKAGIKYVSALSVHAKAVIITVCDQPLLTTSHLEQLISKFKQTRNPIVASRYDQTFGVPVLFADSLFKDLLLINDQSGAKQIINQYKNEVQAIDFPEGATDLDTPLDYQIFLNKTKS